MKLTPDYRDMPPGEERTFYKSQMFVRMYSSHPGDPFLQEAPRNRDGSFVITTLDEPADAH